MVLNDYNSSANVLKSTITEMFTKSDFLTLNGQLRHMAEHAMKGKWLIKVFNFYSFDFLPFVEKPPQITFDHVERIALIAVVGSDKDQNTLSFLFKHFPQAEVRIFSPAQLKEAEDWLDGS